MDEKKQIFTGTKFKFYQFYKDKKFILTLKKTARSTKNLRGRKGRRLTFTFVDFFKCFNVNHEIYPMV